MSYGFSYISEASVAYSLLWVSSVYKSLFRESRNGCQFMKRQNNRSEFLKEGEEGNYLCNRGDTTSPYKVLGSVSFPKASYGMSERDALTTSMGATDSIELFYPIGNLCINLSNHRYSGDHSLQAE